MTVPSKFLRADLVAQGKRGLSQLSVGVTRLLAASHHLLELGRTIRRRKWCSPYSGRPRLPLRPPMRLLLAARLLPVVGRTDLGATPLAPIREALNTFSLAQQEPFPSRRGRSPLGTSAPGENGGGSILSSPGWPNQACTAINLADALVAQQSTHVLRSTPRKLVQRSCGTTFVRSVEATRR